MLQNQITVLMKNFTIEVLVAVVQVNYLLYSNLFKFYNIYLIKIIKQKSENMNKFNKSLNLNN